MLASLEAGGAELSCASPGSVAWVASSWSSGREVLRPKMRLKTFLRRRGAEASPAGSAAEVPAEAGVGVLSAAPPDADIDAHTLLASDTDSDVGGAAASSCGSSATVRLRRDAGRTCRLAGGCGVRELSSDARLRSWAALACAQKNQLNGGHRTWQRAHSQSGAGCVTCECPRAMRVGGEKTTRLPRR